MYIFSFEVFIISIGKKNTGQGRTKEHMQKCQQWLWKYQCVSFSIRVSLAGNKLFQRPTLITGPSWAYFSIYVLSRLPSRTLVQTTRGWGVWGCEKSPEHVCPPKWRALTDGFKLSHPFNSTNSRGAPENSSDLHVLHSSHHPVKVWTMFGNVTCCPEHGWGSRTATGKKRG